MLKHGAGLPGDLPPGRAKDAKWIEEHLGGVHFEDAPSVAGPLPGPKSRDLLREQRSLESRAVTYPQRIPVAFEVGRGATLRDADGNTFIDFFAGAGVVSVGHGNAAVLAAAAEQQTRLVHALDFPTATRARMTRRLKAVIPGDLRASGRIHFGGPTGSDAVEAAIKLARAYSGREQVIAFQGSYHGMTQGALGVTADTALGGGRAAGVSFLPFPYFYRSPLGFDSESCAQACVRLLAATLGDGCCGVPKPAAVVIEPIQGEGGTIVPPYGFLREVRRLTEEHEVLLIVDEIQTGFGRTGDMFACEHEGVTPDILALSKALGGIGYPISCIAFDEKFDVWSPGDHIGTFRGHQVAMAAGSAAIDYMEEMDLVRHAASLGADGLRVLRQAQPGFPSIGEIRGRGLMIGVELVKDRETKEPAADLAIALRRTSAERGLIIEIGGHFENVARFLPPLVISKRLFDLGLEIFLDALRSCECSLGGHHS